MSSPTRKSSSVAPAAAATSPTRKSVGPAPQAATAAPASPAGKPRLSVANKEYKFTPENDKFNGFYEFGGTVGNLGLIAFSHSVIFFFWICIEYYGGNVVHPWHPQLRTHASRMGIAADGDSISTFFRVIAGHLAEGATPSAFHWQVFIGFLLLEYFFAVIMPGVTSVGLPIPSENYTARTYRCNGLLSWYGMLAVAATLHVTGIFPLWTLRENFGRFMTVGVLLGDAFSVILYASGFVLGRAVRLSGNPLHDFFMGSMLNPRLPFEVDVKLFAEIRNSWVLLFLLTSSCASKMYKDHGALSPNMVFICLAHFLYTNACQKGEECIPSTWDIQHEKFGWMLIFWNTAGVPFLYAVMPLYTQTINPTFQYPVPVTIAMFVVLLCAYYVFDTANGQKNRFRMQRQGCDPKVLTRRAFPYLPGGYIPNPKTIKSERGELFVDGWYAHGRKIHYTADIIMAFLWGFQAGLPLAFVPYFYFIFFVSMLMHREGRDQERCKAKYGPLWDQYIKLVPYKLIPGVI